MTISARPGLPKQRLGLGRGAVWARVLGQGFTILKHGKMEKEKR
jgi:hypothetical protein